MKVIVTGSTGFVGRHVVRSLLERGHSVTAVARRADRLPTLDWGADVRFVSCDIHQSDLDVRTLFGPGEAVIHLAWPGLPNYKALSHADNTLFSDYRFLQNLVRSGYHHLLVTGTCLEYGMQCEPLHENMETRPITAYAFAKDTLRRLLELLRSETPFILQWARLFYLFGEGQHPNSLFSQLTQAISRGDKEFSMSGGEQLRDYLPVERAAADIVGLIEHPECDGIINICSGSPTSVRRLAEQLAAGKQIYLKFGAYPYPDYEPMAFWGDRSKLSNAGWNTE